MFTTRPTQRQWLKMLLLDNYHSGQHRWIPVQELRWVDVEGFPKKFIHSFTARITELRKTMKQYGLLLKCKKVQKEKDILLTYYRFEIDPDAQVNVEDFTTHH